MPGTAMQRVVYWAPRALRDVRYWHSVGWYRSKRLLCPTGYWHSVGRLTVCDGRYWAGVWCYAMSGTELAYGAMRCP
eukprot:3940240-Rhodomonas_salina.1